MSNPLEKVIEEKVNAYAKGKDVAVYKFTSPARLGDPGVQEFRHELDARVVG